MHSITKVFFNVRKFIYQKNRKFRKNENQKNGPKRAIYFLNKLNKFLAQKGQKWRMGPNLFQAHNPHQKTKKMSIVKLNSVQWL